MPKIFTIKKEFPCGLPRNNQLVDVLKHYRECLNSECKKRCKALSVLQPKKDPCHDAS